MGRWRGACPTLWVLVFLLSAGATVLHGRLGEDEAGCDVRYNPNGDNAKDLRPDPLNPLLLSGTGTKVRVFRYEGWLITIGFRDGRAARMSYRRESPTAKYLPLRSGGTSPELLKAILTANSVGGGAWREIPREQLARPTGMTRIVKERTLCDRLWVRDDGAIAYDVTSPASLSSGLYLEDRIYVQGHYRPTQQPNAPPKPTPVF